MRPAMLVNILSRGLADRPAVDDGGTTRLDYAHLCNAGDAIGAGLAARGILPGDVVAAAIPGGVAYLAAFAGTATARAALAPLVLGEQADPSERLRGLGARLVLATPAVPQAIRVAAASAGISLAVLDFDDEGVVRLDGEHVFEPNVRVADPDDVVLITAEGPLTHGDVIAEVLAAAAGRPPVSVRTNLSLLDPRGLIAALRVLAAGGQVVAPSEDPVLVA